MPGWPITTRGAGRRAGPYFFWGRKKLRNLEFEIRNSERKGGRKRSASGEASYNDRGVVCRSALLSAVLCCGAGTLARLFLFADRVSAPRAEKDRLLECARGGGGTRSGGSAEETAFASRPGQKPRDAYVFIGFRPVDALSITQEFPLGACILRGGRQAGNHTMGT